MKEVYKPVVGYEGYYEVSNLGNVRSLDRSIIRTRVKSGKEHEMNHIGRVLRPRLSMGYPMVTLKVNNEGVDFRIHRLVATAFIPNPKERPEVNHKDGNKLNNKVTNLEWVTHAENVAHAIINGLRKNQARGERIGNSKLKEYQVREIKQHLAEKTMTQTQMANKYGVSVTAISYIANEVSWAWIKL